MGWRGAVRSMSAAMRAAERDAERRRKHYAKAQMISEASDAVSDWQSAIHELVSLHTDPADEIDWSRELRKPEPSEPRRSAAHESGAQEWLDAFKPRFWDFLFGGSDKRLQKLSDAVPAGREQDDENYRTAIEDYRTQLADWKTDTDLARRLLAGEAQARKEVIAEMQSLSDQGLIGTHISFRISDEFLHAVPHVHGDEIVPNVRRKQLQSGRLSESKMPVGEFNELYQDYVCSAALRVAGDMFALLPLDEVYVTCVATMLNTKTGHQENTPILSARFVRETFRRLDRRHIDPSDSMRNFVHEMDFKRTRGFAGITPLRPLVEI
jgi:hypothetical protein